MFPKKKTYEGFTTAPKFLENEMFTPMFLRAPPAPAFYNVFQGVFFILG